MNLNRVAFTLVKCIKYCANIFFVLLECNIKYDFPFTYQLQIARILPILECICSSLFESVQLKLSEKHTIWKVIYLKRKIIIRCINRILYLTFTAVECTLIFKIKNIDVLFCKKKKTNKNYEY